MRITKIALAGISDLLYHSTKVHTLLDILKENKIRMSVDMGTEPSKVNRQKSSKFRPYFLSFSRVKYGGYARNIHDEVLATIELDGVKLRHKYAGEAVDYWGESYRNPEIYDVDSRLRKNENEDRIYSATPFLEPLNKYVKSIHVALHPVYLEYRDSSSKDCSPNIYSKGLEFEKLYKSISDACDIHAIKVYFYPKFSDMKSMNTRRARTTIGGSNYNFSLILAVNEVFEAILSKNYKDLSEEASRLLLYADYTHNLSGLYNNITNSKRDIAGRNAIDKLVGYMRRFKLKDTDEIEELFMAKKNERYEP